MWKTRFWLPGLLVVTGVTIAIVHAQGPPPGRGPGGFGPPGGPGSLIMLATIPEVQQELAIQEAQKQPLDALQAKMREQADEIFRNFDSFQQNDLAPEEREKRMHEMRTKLEDANQQAEGELIKLLTEKQAKRLQQLRLQREGAQALSRPEIVRQLALSEEQQAKLEEIQQQAFGGFGPPRINPEDQAKALALLTPEQKATWDKLVGVEFKFPEMRGPGGFGRGPGGPGFGGETRKLLKEFDQDNNGWLNLEERRAARSKAASGGQPRGPGGGGPGGGGPGRGPGGPGGGPPGFGGGREPGKPGPRVAPSDVTPNTSAGLYDLGTLRTLFLDFENEDWEAELETFHNTDIEVPATVLVDGQKYPLVGVHFRGMSSYGMVPRGSKRSFNLSFDMVDEKQRLYGYKTLNLLNANGDPSYLSSVLYSQIARNYIAAPKANFVKVVVNGESWGVYVNVQQFDKIFVSENYKSAKGTRWKVPGSPGGNAGLDYIGENIADYKRRYEMKSSDSDDAWRALIKLCRTLKETPPDQLEAALKPMLDIDGVLWFLALDNGLINSDGYWVRASDYSIFLDDKGIFHVIPHDMNEAFHAAGGGPGGPGGRGPGGPGGPRGRGPGGPGGGGPGGFGGPGGPEGRGPGGGYELDPLVGLNDSTKPLRSKLLAVPALREQYLRHVRTLAQDWLAAEKFNALVQSSAAVIEKELEIDTRKNSSFAAFQQAVSATAASATPEAGGRRGGANLATFAKERRKYLLEYPEIKRLK